MPKSMVEQIPMNQSHCAAQSNASRHSTKTTSLGANGICREKFTKMTRNLTKWNPCPNQNHRPTAPPWQQQPPPTRRYHPKCQGTIQKKLKTTNEIIFINIQIIYIYIYILGFMNIQPYSTNIQPTSTNTQRAGEHLGGLRGQLSLAQLRSMCLARSPRWEAATATRNGWFMVGE